MGKWIIASDEGQISYLHDLKDRAGALGVPMEFLSARQAASLEPNVIAKEVLLSPSTGIVDSHGLMECLEVSFRKFSPPCAI